MSTVVPNEIVLFHYPFSPYARRVIWYLQLRGIEFAQCVRPLPPAVRQWRQSAHVPYRNP